MADASAVRAGRAFVEVFADTGPLARGLKKASRMLSSWGAGLRSVGMKLAAVGSVGVTGFLATVKAAADAGSALSDMSQRTGTSVEALSALKYAAEQSGTTLDAVEVGIKKLSVGLADAASGSKSARDKFKALGLSWESLSKLSPDEQLIAVAEQISRIQDPAKKTSSAIDIFGKSGADLIPLMNEGSSGIAKMTAEARKLGIVMSGKDATASAEFGDKLDKAFALVSSGVQKIGSALMPVLLPMLDTFVLIASATGKWIDENRGLVTVLFAASAGVVAFGAGLIVAGTVLTALGAVVGSSVAVFSTLGAVLGSLSVLCNPLGLALVAVVAGLAGMTNWSKVSSDSLKWLGTGFEVLKTDAVAAFGAIGAAIAGGDLKLATQVLWSFLKLEWAKGATALLESWYAVTTPMVEAWHKAQTAISKFAINSWFGLQKEWTNTVESMSIAWTVFSSSIVSGWLTAQQQVSAGIMDLRGLMDKNFDANAAKTMLNFGFGVQKNLNDNAMNQKIGESNKRRTDQVGAIDKQQTDALANVQDAADTTKLARQKKRDDTLAQLQQEAIDAQKAMSDSLAKAAELAKQNEAKKQEKTSPAIDGALSAAADSITGTFNAAGVGGMGGNGQVLDYLSRIAAMSEKTKNEISSLRTDLSTVGTV